MNDISIEYAHIYTNNKIEVEQLLSLETLKKVKNDFKSKSVVFTILVDDYSFPDPTFDYDEYSVWLKNEGFPPDIIFRESQLIPLCDEVLKLMKNEKLKTQLTDYIIAKKYPCSLFIAAWYMLRLGILMHPSFSTNLYAKSLVNILPESFKPFEDKAIEIIKATNILGVDDLIQYIYIEGRLIA